MPPKDKSDGGSKPVKSAVTPPATESPEVTSDAAVVSKPAKDVAATAAKPPGARGPALPPSIAPDPRYPDPRGPDYYHKGRAVYVLAKEAPQGVLFDQAALALARSRGWGRNLASIYLKSLPWRS